MNCFFSISSDVLLEGTVTPAFLFDKAAQEEEEQLYQIIHQNLPGFEPKRQRVNALAFVATYVEKASAYMECVEQDIDNLDRAIRYYHKALDLLDPEVYPEEWGEVCFNIGKAYTITLLGDRSILKWNLMDKSIAYFAFALLDRPRGERFINVTTAIKFYQNALEVFTPEKFPDKWENIQLGFGLAYQEPSTEGGMKEDIERSIACLQNVLNVMKRATSPGGWSLAHIYLGDAYLKRKRGDQADNIEHAIQHFQLALDVKKGETDIELSYLQTKLGNAYAKRILGKQKENLQMAAAAYQQALREQTLENNSEIYLSIHRHLGSLYFKEGRWAEALAAYNTAIAARELLYHAGSHT